DQSLIRVRSLVFQKSSDLFAGRRQTDQLKMDSPEQRAPIGILRRSQRSCFQLPQNERVDRRQRPSGRSDRRRPMFAQWTKSPVLSTRDRVGRVTLALVL